MPAAVDEEIIPDIRDVVFRKCTAAWEMPENKLGSGNFTYVIQGEARYVIDGETIELTPGSLLFLKKDTIRRGITFPGRLMHCFSVDFDLRGAKKQSASALPFPILSQPGRHEDLVHMFHDLSFAWLNKQPGYMIKSRGLFLQIVSRFLELLVFKGNTSSGDSRITRAIHYIAAHYSERITVKNMAKMTGLHPTYFGTLFHAEMGVSLNRYLIQTRVKNAEIMLSSGEYKVGDVAESCGFTDISHFYKQFKMIKGFPPSHSLPKKF